MLSLDLWPLDDPHAVILFGSAAHNMRYGTVAQYEAQLAAFGRRLAAALRPLPAAATLHWLVGSASHIHDDELGCSRARTTHLMSFHRSLLFAALGAEAMRHDGAVRLLDMWQLSADQPHQSEGVHYDELYVYNRSAYGDGLVSRATANLLLNLACNPRLLPPARLQSKPA